MTLHMSQQDIRYYGVAQKLSSLLGRKWGVTVEFGHHPSTDGSVVRLPHWDLDDPLAKTALFGCIAHEAGGHVAQTDFDLFNQMIQSRSSDPFVHVFKSIVNICEDIRIENNLHAQYPGVRPYINAAIELVINRQPLEDIDPEAYWPAMFGWLLNRYRSHFLKQTVLLPRLEKWDPVARDLVDTHYLVRAEILGKKLLEIGPSQAEFQEVLDISEELLQLLLYARPSQNQPPQDPDTPPDQHQQGEDQSQSDPSSSENHTSTDENGVSSGSDQDEKGNSDEAEESAKTDDQSRPDASDASGDDTEGGDKSSGENGKPGSDAGADPSSKDGGAAPDASAGQTQATEFVPAKADETVPSSESGDIFGDLKELAEKPDAPPMDVSSCGGNAKATGKTQDASISIPDARSMVSPLIPALSPLLNGDTFMDDHRKFGSNIDSALLTKTRTDHHARVFTRKIVEEDQSVALSLLIDRSSSTSGDCYKHITASSLGLTLALDTFPEVETTICHFPAADLSRGHVVTKSADQHVNACLSNWPQPSGGTPLAEAYQSVALNLLASDKERRMILVVTDGRPASVDEVFRARDFVRLLGIEIYGIVVGEVNYPLGLFDQSEVIASSNELPAAMSRLVLRIL